MFHSARSVQSDSHRQVITWEASLVALQRNVQIQMQAVPWQYKQNLFQWIFEKYSVGTIKCILGEAETKVKLEPRVGWIIHFLPTIFFYWVGGGKRLLSDFDFWFFTSSSSCGNREKSLHTLVFCLKPYEMTLMAAYLNPGLQHNYR